jgi:hypothetical protein
MRITEKELDAALITVPVRMPGRDALVVSQVPGSKIGEYILLAFH